MLKKYIDINLSIQKYVALPPAIGLKCCVVCSRDIWLINFLLPPRRQWLVTRARQYFTGSGLEHMHGHTGLWEILE